MIINFLIIIQVHMRKFRLEYYQIMKCGIQDKVGTYSTSVYLDKKPCEKFVKCLKKKIYPHPIILQGRTTNGLVQRTIEREKDYSDKLHVDWWIFEGEVEKVFENFHESEEV